MRTLRSSASVAPLAAALVALAAFPYVGGKFYVDLVLTTMILSIFALSLELLVGNTGLVSFGHAAFFGIGAYATALLTPSADAPSLAWLLPAVVVFTGLAAAAIGALSLRTRGIYFIMVTLAFAQMAYFVFHDTKLAGKVPFFGGREITRAAAIVAAAEDWGDHYSQLAIYLRLNGLLPPTAKQKEE